MSGGVGTSSPAGLVVLPPKLVDSLVVALRSLMDVAPDEPRGAARCLLERISQAGTSIDESSVRDVREQLTYWKGPFLDGADGATPDYWSALEKANLAADAIVSHCVCERRPDLALVVRANKPTG